MTYGASSFTKAAKPDVLPDTLSVLMESYFSLTLNGLSNFQNGFTKQEFLMASAYSQMIKNRKETSFTKKHRNVIWLYAKRK